MRIPVLALLALAALSAPAQAAERCPASTPASAVRDLRSLNDEMWRFGPRPTGSPAHQRFIGWLERELDRIPGVRLADRRYRIDRWDGGRATLNARLGGADVALPTAGPVPYSRGTGPAGATAPLTYLPPDVPITPANATGRIVVRDVPVGTVPMSVFGALQDFAFDPAHTIRPQDPYERDFLDYGGRTRDLEAAGAAGAAGLVYVHGLPRAQVDGHYAPYEGIQWPVPAVYLGVDEGQRLKDALAAGTAADATLAVPATRRRATTRTLLATIRGHDRRRILVESHTDGVNALWDNGPIAMLAMARHLARLPRACRPRTIQFAFTTGHLYQHLVSKHVRDGGAEQLAARLDREYDRGALAAVVVLEHLGAREYAPRPRRDGPGRVLERTGRSELALVPVSRSPALIRAVRAQIVRHDLRRHLILRGADAPGDRVPPHCSFGGEGTPYNKHLLPTVAIIAAPWTLFDPPFGLESIDFDLMGRQTRAFTDLTLRLGRMSPQAIAGQVSEFRRRRRSGAAVCPA